MHDTFTPLTKSFYGDNPRWFFGSIISNTPPAGFEGRLQVRIYGVHSDSIDDVPDADLPWAQAVLPTTEGGGSGIGKIPQILPGSLVFGIFIDGQTSQIPLIIGSVPKREYPTAIQQDFVSSSYSNLNFIGTPTTTNTVPESVSDSIANFPQRKVRRRSEGMKFFIDNGYTIEQAAGIVGNMESISEFETTENGICDWKGSRKDQLVLFGQNFTRDDNGKTPVHEKFSVQLRFVLHELRTTKTIANNKLLKSRLFSGRNGSVEIIRRYYIDGKESEKRPLNIVLKNSELARNEVYGLQ